MTRYRTVEGAGVYDYPAYWDLAFRDETADEMRFLRALADREGWDRPRTYEPGCGGGRLVAAMAAAGWDVTACDLNERCVAYVRRRLRRRGLSANVDAGDMTEYVCRRPADLAVCPVNTFRHLTSESAARRHLDAVAASVRPGGLYVLGLHLAPPDTDPEDSERWSAAHGRCRIDAALKVVHFDRRRRLERLRFTLRVRGRENLRLVSEFDYRLYTAAQIRRTVEASGDWRIESVHDFWWELDDPLPLNDDRGDTVLLLRRS